MDCSKTEVFLREWKRLCSKYSCTTCPIKEMDMCFKRGLLWTEDCLKKLPEAMQRWSDEHPQETILEHFKKILPNMAMIKNHGKIIPQHCPDSFDSRISPMCLSKMKGIVCVDCWNRPYDEAIKGE